MIYNIGGGHYSDEVECFINQIFMDRRMNMKDKETNGTIIAASKQWWLKVNRKPIRLHALDDAEFPYIIKVQ